jgi:acetyltransferase
VTTRNFDALFDPKVIALVGASNQPGSVGAVLARNLFGGGFTGPILTVNPHETAIRSSLNYRSIAELPLVPDLAVVATPPGAVPGVVAELAAKGTRAAVVITGGLDPTVRQAMLDAGRPALMRIVGPNTLGFLSPGKGINASFAQLTPARGDIAFLTQSGAIATTVLDWAAGRGLGFSHLVSLGDMSDVDFGDLLDHLALDTATRAILLYVESVTHARKFMSAARIAARAKPVIVVKGGRSRSGAKAAASHTGALAGADAVYEAAFRRAGMLRVYELRELFEAAETVASGLKVHGPGLTVLTNGGGAGVLAADALEAMGGELAPLGDGLREVLDGALPPGWSHANPIDILGDATGARYGRALQALEADPSRDALLVMTCPTGVTDSTEIAEAVIAARPAMRRPVLTCWLGAATAAEARRRFAEARIPSYETPDEAVRAFMHLVDYRRNQALLMEAPAAGTHAPAGAAEAARALVRAAMAEGRTALDEAECRRLFDLYGVPTVATRTAADLDAAVAAAAGIGFPVALKILSPDISHKSDVGGVALSLADAAAVRAAGAAMLARVAAERPEARIAGFTVQQMARRPRARELIVGVARDATFGPVVLFGHGGVTVEVVADRVVGLPPLNPTLAREMIGRTRIARLLGAWRDTPAADLDAVGETLVRIGELALDLPEIAELDINPLLADAGGVLALDGRVRLAPPGIPPAIRPYPAELERAGVMRDGRAVAVRPIRPEDAQALVGLVAACDADDVRLRFLGVLAGLPEAQAARLSQIDYDREMALVALDPAAEGAILAVARLYADPNNEAAEFAILVRTDLKGRGLGRLLLGGLLGYARARGLQRVWGVTLEDNGAMLDLARFLGARVAREGGEVRMTFELTPPGAGPAT